MDQYYEHGDIHKDTVEAFLRDLASGLDLPVGCLRPTDRLAELCGGWKFSIDDDEFFLQRVIKDWALQRGLSLDDTRLKTLATVDDAIRLFDAPTGQQEKNGV